MQGLGRHVAPNDKHNLLLILPQIHKLQICANYTDLGFHQASSQIRIRKTQNRVTFHNGVTLYPLLSNSVNTYSYMQGIPVSEALFNFVNAWSLMFLPLILSDKKRNRVGKKVLWWTGIMVCHNFLDIYCMNERRRLHVYAVSIFMLGISWLQIQVLKHFEASSLVLRRRPQD